MSKKMRERKAYGFIHCHTTHSLKDSPLQVKDLVKTAKEMGAQYVSITDHGTCTGWFEFIRECEANDIHPIPGVEAYMKTEYNERAHLILLAKNYDGFKEIAKAVSLSNDPANRIHGYPVMNWDILKECFGNGNVKATSACIGGVLASTLLANSASEKSQNSIKKKLARKKIPDRNEYLKKKEMLEAIDKKIAEISEENKILKKLASKKYSKRKKAVESLKAATDDEIKIKNDALKKLQEEMAESENAERKIQENGIVLSDIKQKRKPIKAFMTKADKQLEGYNNLKKELDQMSEKKYSDDFLLEETEKQIEKFKSLFGDDFFIELQYHGIEQEKYVYPVLARLAEKHNIKTVATNDVHIRTKEDAPARQILMSLRFQHFMESRESDSELYMKSDEELKSALCMILPEKTAQKAIDGIRDVCDGCDVHVPKDTHYPAYRDITGQIVPDSAALLRKKVEEGIQKRFPDGSFSEKYQKRLEYELGVIIGMGFADYLLIVSDYIQEGKKISAEIGRKLIGVPLGYNVGPGRGSGAGCLTNYLIGITAVDPLKYNLKFERFLNRARVSMPDIDADFGDEVRAKVIEYVTKKYGADSVAGIRTVIRYAGKDAIKNVARVEGWKEIAQKGYSGEKTPEGKAVMKKWRKYGERLAGAVEKDMASADFSDFTDECEKKIIKLAPGIDGSYSALGIHAAGIIISDGTPLREIVPLLYNTDMQEWAVQCDMIDSEGMMKLLKMDFLGLNNLDVLTDAIRDIYKRHGTVIDLDKIDTEDSSVYKDIFASGNTGCVFQFESQGMRKMLRDFQPSCFEDIVLLVAAYRPGPMENIPKIISNKKGITKPHYIVPSLEPILAPTYGIPVYQEQLMDIFHICAGFTLEEADNIRKFMSKKKVEKFLAYKDQFIAGMTGSGADKKEAEDFWDSLVSFASYGFNKSHAVAYGFISYQTAYLKKYYPEEYMCAVINHTKREKLPLYLSEVKNLGIEILPPDINRSYEKFTVESKGAIRYGFSLIKGVSSAGKFIADERMKNGKYTSFISFIERMKLNDFEYASKIKIDTLESGLVPAGCFDEMIGQKRQGLCTYIKPIFETVKNIEKLKDRIASISEDYEKADTKSAKTKLSKRISAEKDKESGFYKMLYDYMEKVSLYSPDDKSAILRDEKELLGLYLSGHPLDPYESYYKRKNFIPLAEREISKKAWYLIMVHDLRVVRTKKTNEKIAFFTAEDKSGTVSAGCFTEAFKKCEDSLKEDAVIGVFGKITRQKVYGEDDKYEDFLSVERTEMISASQKAVIVSYENVADFDNFIKKFSSENASLKVIKRDAVSGAVEKTDFFISEDVFDHYDYLYRGDAFYLVHDFSDLLPYVGANGNIIYPQDEKNNICENHEKPEKTVSRNSNPPLNVKCDFITDSNQVYRGYACSFISVHELDPRYKEERNVLAVIA